MLGMPCGASSANALKAPRCASSAGLTQHPDQRRPDRRGGGPSVWGEEAVVYGMG